MTFLVFYYNFFLTKDIKYVRFEIVFLNKKRSKKTVKRRVGKEGIYRESGLLGKDSSALIEDGLGVFFLSIWLGENGHTVIV